MKSTLFRTRIILTVAVITAALLASPGQAQYVVRPGNSNPVDLLTPLPNLPSPGAGAATLPVPTPTQPYSNYGGGLPYFPGYNFDFYGLQGAAQVIDSQGKYMMDAEWARVIREQANQAQLKTQKEKFDLQRYIEENTPKWSDYQKKILAKRLERIREQATPGEIFSGSALNLLLRDMATKQFKTIDFEMIPPLSKEVLSHLNVSAPGNNGTLGLLRDAGEFVWPNALQKIVAENDQINIEKVAKSLVVNVADGTVSPKLHAELSDAIEKIREDLKTQVLEIPTDQYLQAKRFLNEFREALRALQSPALVKQELAYRQFASKDRSVKEVIDHIVSNGLEFAPATQGDEFAYQALYSSLASYDVAFNMVSNTGLKK